MSEQNTASTSNFIRQVIDADLKANKFASRHWSGQPADATTQQSGALDTAAIRTRFPPEPNGYLHIGHAKSIFVNFGTAADYNGICHLRFDDTNPEKESQEYVDAITDAVNWLVGDAYVQNGTKHLYFASNYFDFMHRAAVHLIEQGLAYVDEQTPDEMRTNRGDFQKPGTDSPYRTRSAEENLQRFADMRDGKVDEGKAILRAKIDMAHPNLNMRDPAIYRVRHAHHHNTGDAWCIYPMYTFAHPIEDALENITHSLCTLEFEDQRPFYDWLLCNISELFYPDGWTNWLDNLRDYLSSASKAYIDDIHQKISSLWSHEYKRLQPGSQKVDDNPFMKIGISAIASGKDSEAYRLEKLLEELSKDKYFALQFVAPKLWKNYLSESQQNNLNPRLPLPKQIEFARLNLTYVVTSKRKLKQLVDEQHVSGWDDPRLPTIAGLRRRGYTPESLKLFAERIGVSKADSWIDYSTLEGSLRDTLDSTAPRALAVQDPLKLVLTNWDELMGADHQEPCTAAVHPHHPDMGERQFTLGKEVWIERGDFNKQPPKGYRRLFPEYVNGAGATKPAAIVRLKYGYVIECTGYAEDDAGNITEVHAKVIPDTKSGTPGADSVKAKGVIGWVNCHDGVEAEFRLYDRLFTEEQPDAGGKNFLDHINPNSLTILNGYVEPSAATANNDQPMQFERMGYYVADREDSTSEKPVFNMAVGLKDSWGKKK